MEIKQALEQLKENFAVQEANSDKKYNELKYDLTQISEAANAKASIAESRLKETEALLKLKEAELAEVKISASKNCSIPADELVKESQDRKIIVEDSTR